MWVFPFNPLNGDDFDDGKIMGSPAKPKLLALGFEYLGFVYFLLHEPRRICKDVCFGCFIFGCPFRHQPGCPSAEKHYISPFQDLL